MLSVYTCCWNATNSSALLLETECTQNLMKVLKRLQEQAHKKEDNAGNYEASRLYSVVIFLLEF